MAITKVATTRVARTGVAITGMATIKMAITRAATIIVVMIQAKRGFAFKIVLIIYWRLILEYFTTILLIRAIIKAEL